MTKQNRLCLSGSRTIFYLRPLWRAQIMASVPSAKLSLLKFPIPVWLLCTSYIKKSHTQVSGLLIHLKNLEKQGQSLEKQEQTKPKPSWCQEIVKIRTGKLMAQIQIKYEVSMILISGSLRTEPWSNNTRDDLNVEKISCMLYGCNTCQLKLIDLCSWGRK